MNHPKVVKKPLTPEEVLKTPPTRWEKFRDFVEVMPLVLQVIVSWVLFGSYTLLIFGVCKLTGIGEWGVTVWVASSVVMVFYFLFTRHYRGSKSGNTLSGSGYI